MIRQAFAISALSVALAAPAVAALPFGTLEYVQRTGTVTNTESIPVVMRLTLDPDSPPLTFSSNPLTGFSSEDIPTEGQFFNPATGQNETRPFAEVQSAFLNTVYFCQGNFTDVCSPSANYRFDFNLVSTPGNPSINFLDSFELAAGQSFDYTFGYFVPTAGGAAPGVYRWAGTALTLNFSGVDVDGNVGYAYDAMRINSNASLDPGQAFERVVVAIPEPGTYGLMALGLAAVGIAARRRRHAP